MYIYLCYVHTLRYMCIDELLVSLGDADVVPLLPLPRVHRYWNQVEGERCAEPGRVVRDVVGGVSRVGAPYQGYVGGDVASIVLAKVERRLVALIPGINEWEIIDLLDKELSHTLQIP